SGTLGGDVSPRRQAFARAPPSPLGELGDSTYPSRAPAQREESALEEVTHADAPLEVPPLSDRRPAGPALARHGRRARADLVLDRPPRRQPGARQPDGLRAQAAHVRP